jgi:hypothetical protein
MMTRQLKVQHGKDFGFHIGRNTATLVRNQYVTNISSVLADTFASATPTIRFNLNG